MQTENLNEMVQQVSNNPIDLNKPDYVYTLHRDKLMYDDVKKDISNVEKPATESISTNLEVVPKSSITNIPSSNFEPASEEALIAYTASIHNKVQTYSIRGYWEIGRTINSFYRGKYGTQELERISIATGIGRDTLNKMCKFAKQYSRDQVEVLLSGAFYVSWFQISQNLTVEPEKLITVYKGAVDVNQFHNGIMKFKSPKVRPPESLKQASTLELSIASPIKEPKSGLMIDPPIRKNAEAPVTPQSDEIQKLQLQNDNNYNSLQVSELNKIIRRQITELKDKDELILKLRLVLQRVHTLIEVKSDHTEILELINWNL